MIRRKTRSFLLLWQGVQGGQGMGGKSCPSAASAVGIFCSFQEGLRKRVVSKAVAWKVALLLCLGF